jgi:ribosomal protein L34E
MKHSITPNSNKIVMVLSMTDQHKPKCYLCGSTFESIEELRKHQEADHKNFVEFHKNSNDRTPAPGDVTVF